MRISLHIRIKVAYICTSLQLCNYTKNENMNRIVLKAEIVDKIKSDPELLKKVADTLGVSEKSLPRLLYGNDLKLTSAGVLKVLRESLGLTKDSSLLSELQIKEVA